MTARAVAIRLKIPDNEAYTALTALRRLGVAVERLERAAILVFAESSEDPALRVMRSETLFNPNKHVLQTLEGDGPRAGEAWIEELGTVDSAADVRRYVGWRLLDANGEPVAADVVRSAAERLLCNPAIERAIVR